jgi:hypothetical protein
MALALAAMVATATVAHAAGIPIAITPTTGDSYQINNCPGSVCNLSGWDNAGYKNNGYNFVFDTAAHSISPGVNTGPQNGLELDGDTGSNGSSFIALDADYQRGAVTTTLSALAADAGDVVTLTFDFAASQQKLNSDGCGFCQGNYDALLAVTLGGAAPTSGGALLDAAVGATSGDTTTGSSNCSNAGGHSPCILSQEWSGWESESLTFKVGSGSTNDVLSFLASDPNGQNQVPAFALIDNLSFTVAPAVPEPNSLLLLSTGLLGLGGYMRMRSKSSAATKA